MGENGFYFIIKIFANIEQRTQTHILTFTFIYEKIMLLNIKYCKILFHHRLTLRLNFLLFD